MASTKRAECDKVKIYQDLKNALREEWEFQSIEIIIIIICATGVMKDNLQYVKNIQGKLYKHQIQVAAI